ncbi:MAG: hypothetical protein ACR2GO_01475 [Candidatus Limnocylindria bacterium]
MPSHERTRRFERDWKSLGEADRSRFRVAFKRYDFDLEKGSFRPGLRIKRVEGTDSVFEMTWAPNGRATFEYGTPDGPSARVTGRRIGHHDVFRRP